MKKIVIWENENDEILFKENVLLIDLPRIGETVIYMTNKIIIANIIHNFDEKHIIVKVKSI